MEVVTHFSVLDPTSGSKSSKPVVVTQAFCKSIIASIKSKTQPYWDVEAQKCNVETRAELVTQCSTIITEFRGQISDVCPPSQPPLKLPLQPCTENCFKPVKHVGVPKATVPKWSAFPEPADAAVSRRKAQAQEPVPMLQVTSCSTPPCPQVPMLIICNIPPCQKKEDKPAESPAKPQKPTAAAKVAAKLLDTTTTTSSTQTNIFTKFLPKQ